MTGVNLQTTSQGGVLTAWAQVCALFARSAARRSALLAVEDPLRECERELPAREALTPLLAASLRLQSEVLSMEQQALRAAQTAIGRIAGREPVVPLWTAAWLARALEALRALAGTREALAMLTRRIAQLPADAAPSRIAALLAERRRILEAAEDYRREFVTADERAWRKEGGAATAILLEEEDETEVLDPIDGWHTWLDEVVDSSAGAKFDLDQGSEMSPKSGPIGALGAGLFD